MVDEYPDINEKGNIPPPKMKKSEEFEFERDKNYQFSRTQEQKRVLRYWICIGVALLIVLLIAFEWMLFSFMKNSIAMESLNAFFFLYASIPILSITLIVIFLITGIFRGFKDNDIESLVKKTPMYRLLNQANSE